MKKSVVLFLAILCVFTSGFSQDRISKQQLELFKKNLSDNPLLKDDDPDFAVKGISGKWNDESAVILCQKTTFDFDKKGISVGRRLGRNILGLLFALPTFGYSMVSVNSNNHVKILVEETERRKILLKDKFALDLYSVLYFRLNNDGDAFDARVHKKDGTIQKVSVEDAVKVENVKQVPEIFTSYTDNNINSSYRPLYYKVVMPDLEEGDILEYEYINYNTKTYDSNPDVKEFDPVYYLCNRSMPVNKQIIEVVMDDDKYHLGYKSLQGAPDFVSSSKGKNTYRWEDNNRDKMPALRYVNKYLDMPSVKFQVIYAKNNVKDYIFVGDQKDMKKNITDEDFSEKSKKIWFSDYTGEVHNSSDDEYVKEIYKLLKKRGAVESADDEYVRKAFYTIRSKTLYNKWSSYQFAKVFAGLLEKKRMAYDVVATSSNTLSNINNVAFTKEILWVIKYKNKYYSNPDEHINAAEIPLWLNGNKAVAFSSDEKTKVVTEVLPSSDTVSNVMHYIIKANVAEDMQISIDENAQLTGLVKQTRIDDILVFTPFMESDYKNYDGDDMWAGLSEKNKEKFVEEFNAQKKEWKEEKPKIMKAMIEEEFNHEVQGNVNFKIINDGRSFKKQSLIYTQNFNLSNMIAKAGQDMVVAIPSLIGEQSQIKKEERNRQTLIDVGYPRSLIWNINFAIPAGYTVQGYDKLQQNIRNETGSFVSTAQVEGNSLVLNIKKIYNSKYPDLKNWPLLVQVLDAAFNYSQAKIILKKVN
ncbi:MAG: hypothetical protein ABIN97_13495 [Ginsengibacter sp.]